MTDDRFPIIRLDVPADAAVGDVVGDFIDGLPVHYLVDTAIEASVDDHITEHAEHLFLSLDARGRHGWHQAAAHLAEKMATHYGTGLGPEAADALRASTTADPANPPRPPFRDATLLTAAWMQDGRGAFENLAADWSDHDLSHATRALVAMCISAAGWARDARPGSTTHELFHTLVPTTEGNPQ